MIRRIMSVTAATVLILGAAQDAAAQTAAVTYEVTTIREMSVSGNPAKLLINTAAKMSGVEDVSTTWSVTTNDTMKVQGAVTTLPAGVTLKVNLAKPAGTSVSTERSLGATALDLVTGIVKLQESGMVVTYTLSATPEAGTVTEAIATVTYTVVAGV